MFCPDCGEEIKDSNQELCNKCGRKILSSNKITKLKINQNEYKTPLSQKLKSMHAKVLVSPQEATLELYSKRYLADGIISIIIAAISLFCGLMVTIFSILMELFFPLSPGQFIIRTIILIILVILYVIGLIFALASRSNSKKFESFNAKNGTQKTRKVLWIIGIFLNSIFLGLFLIILVISILN
ncbi:MAG: hypothetical protein ACFE8E_02390 [Candidatus Hodarchaeota archaeon]